MTAEEHRLFRPRNPPHRQRCRRLGQKARHGHERRRDVLHRHRRILASTARKPSMAGGPAPPRGPRGRLQHPALSTTRCSWATRCSTCPANSCHARPDARHREKPRPPAQARIHRAGAPSAPASPPKGLDAIKWWRQGKLMEIAEYCCFDVKVTKLVHEYGASMARSYYTTGVATSSGWKIEW